MCRALRSSSGTAAVHDDNPEVVRAHELGIPVMERAEAWAA